MHNKRFLTAALVCLLAATSAEAAVTSVTEKSGPYELNYPRVTVQANAAAQTAINADLLRRVEGYKQAVNFGQPLTATQQRNHYHGTLTYETKYEDDAVLSLILYHYFYMGGAHGGTLAEGVVYDKQTGAVLPLSHFLRITPEQLREELTSAAFNLQSGLRLGSDLYSPDRLTEVPENYYLGGHGKVCPFFQQYEIAPYSTGFVTAHITAGRVNYYNILNRPKPALPVDDKPQPLTPEELGDHSVTVTPPPSTPTTPTTPAEVAPEPQTETPLETHPLTPEELAQLEGTK